MKLRDHPMMIRTNGYQSWPPSWTTTHQDRDGKPVGEVGTLEDVVRSHITDNKIFLFMESDGFRYMGFITFDDPPCCHEIYRLLKHYVGRPIKEIGNLEVSFTAM
jgi:hypothetical protein